MHFYRFRLICEDIAGGKENFPIPATNLVDDACFPPEGMCNIIFALFNFKKTMDLLNICDLYFYICIHASIYVLFICNPLSDVFFWQGPRSSKTKGVALVA